MQKKPSLSEGLAQLANLAVNQSGEQKKLFADDIYKNRYRNFLTLPLYWLVIGLFVFLGIRYKARFPIISWYVFMGLAIFFFLLSLIFFFSYAHVIIKSWRTK